ncbi:hypothetical protein E3U55_16830 [Filobacillus milosensis]|uniref:Mercuric transport protein MerT n=1 Tax=Filobacillus milosensis TaxID=94137 RepID=A0A4Y8IDV9_9BACI|nr:hypothetical protein [Filobacillus milosensis]TFB12987.1 hypothetical protein E3U55_16830 [Filobacillus milosensis]
MKEITSQLATLFSGFVMAGCCLGPLVLIPLGLTSFAGELAIYATKYQTMLISLTLVLLAYSFYLVYGRNWLWQETIEVSPKTSEVTSENLESASFKIDGFT